jgi:phosphohistidine phosphatase
LKLYLVRHGRALPVEQDISQPLSAEGRDDITRLARTLQNLNVRVAKILHSGKLRAEETAHILAGAIQPPQGVKAVQGLEPNAGTGPILDLVEQEEEDLMIVGHLPFLASFLQALLRHPDQDSLPVFDTGCAVGVEKVGRKWQIFRTLGPRMIF